MVFSKTWWLFSSYSYFVQSEPLQKELSNYFRFLGKWTKKIAFPRIPLSNEHSQESKFSFPSLQFIFFRTKFSAQLFWQLNEA